MDIGSGETAWGRYASAGALIAGVLVVLLLGAVLQADGDETGSRIESVEIVHPDFREGPHDGLEERPVIAADDPPAIPDTAARQEHERTAAPHDSGDPLARARRDQDRLDDAGVGWTLQFGSFREEEPVRDLLRTLSERDELYIVREGDQFKVWWGHVATRDRAVSQRGIPAALSALSAAPFPKRVGGGSG